MSAVPVSAVSACRWFVASVLAALASTTTAVVVFMLYEDMFDWMLLSMVIVVFLFAWAHAGLLGLPYAWLLLRMGRFRRLTMLAGGAVVGGLPVMLLGADMIAVALYAGLGMVGALAFHATIVSSGAYRAGVQASDATPTDADREKPSGVTVPVRVYYNSACPVCRTGIGMQQDAMGACEIEWIDVHANPDAVRELGVDIEAVRERLHVRDAEGVKVGADAAAALWSRTRGLRWASRLLALPRVRALAQHAYAAFARWLYRWNRRHGRW